MSCKGVCDKYKADKPVGIGRYASGQRRCQICEIYMHWNGLWCPCCGYRLRCKPRNVTYKEKLKETEFKAGTVVRLYKHWKECTEFQFKAVLVEQLKPTVQGIGALWLIRNLADSVKNPECKTEKRIINIANKDKVLV
jgi:hypothetical protein